MDRYGQGPLHIWNKTPSYIPLETDAHNKIQKKLFFHTFLQGCIFFILLLVEKMWWFTKKKTLKNKGKEVGKCGKRGKFLCTFGEKILFLKRGGRAKISYFGQIHTPGFDHPGYNNCINVGNKKTAAKRSRSFLPILTNFLFISNNDDYLKHPVITVLIQGGQIYTTVKCWSNTEVKEGTIMCN